MTAAICTAALIFPSAISLTASAAEYSADGYTLTYTISGSSAVITDYSGTVTSLTIPSSVGGYTVTAIDSEAFAEVSGLTDVTIPDSVTSIDERAFWNCKSLKNVFLGSGVSQIGTYAFSACPRLDSFSVSASNSTYTAVNGMLYSYDGSTLISYAGGSSADVPEGTKTIGKAAFFGNSALNSVKLPSGLTSIGDYAFSGCFSLGKVSVPLTVTSLGKGSFMNCSVLTEVTLGAGLRDIPEECFSMCTSLESIYISSNITKIGAGAFFSCQKLAGIYIPASVVSIGTDAVGTHYNIRTGKNEPFKDFYITGDRGSAAHKYAIATGFDFIDSMTPPYGDVDADGYVNAVDASLVLTEYAKTATGNPSTLTFYERTAADYNCDGAINALDASLILTEYAENATNQM